MNLAVWERPERSRSKKLMLDTSREAQTKCRKLTESVDNFAAAKKELEPKGMTVVEADVDAFQQGRAAEDLAAVQAAICRPVGSDRGVQGVMSLP